MLGVNYHSTSLAHLIILPHLYTAFFLMALNSTAELLLAGRAADARFELACVERESLNSLERAALASTESACLHRQEAQQTVPALERQLTELERCPAPTGGDRLAAAAVSFALAYQICRVGTAEKAAEVSARAVLLVRPWFGRQALPPSMGEATVGVDWPMKEFEELWTAFGLAEDSPGTAACAAAKALGRAAALSLTRCNRVPEARALVELHKRCCVAYDRGSASELTLLEAAVSAGSGDAARARISLDGAAGPGCTELLAHLLFVASSDGTSGGEEATASRILREPQYLPVRNHNLASFLLPQMHHATLLRRAQG